MKTQSSPFFIRPMNLVRMLSSILLLMLLSLLHQLQAQQNIPQPHENRPIDFTSTPELIVYLAIPVAALLLYWFLKRKRKQDRKM